MPTPASRVQIKRWLWLWRGVLFAIPAATALTIGIREMGLLQGPELLAYDQMLQGRPREPIDRRVAIISITDADLQRFGTTSLPDGVYATAIERLKAMGPRAIGLDIYRDLPHNPGHDRLVRVFRNTPYLIAIAKVQGKNAADRVAPPPALAGTDQFASNDFVADLDGRVRRTFISTVDPKNPDQQVYGLGLYLALLYLERDGIGPEEVPNEPWSFRLQQAVFRRLQSNDGGYIRTNDAGNQLLLNYRGPRNSFEMMSISDLVDGKVPANWARDRVILIGNVSESGRDFFTTPYSGGLRDVPDRMFGVEIHAHFASEVISAAKEGRPLIASWPEPVEWLWIGLWSAAGAALAWLLRLPDSRWRLVVWAVGGSVGAIGLLLAACQVAMIQGVWIPLVPPLVSLVSGAAAVAIYLAQTAGQIRNTFGRYLNSEVVSNLLEDPEGLKMGGERRKITILTSDLRGFTATAERLPPEKVIEIINLYLEAMADAIVSFQGTIDEFMGDGILVLFGAPTARLDDGKRAIACAVAMQQAMAGVNQRLVDLGYQALEMGIGINTGEVVVGNIGSYKRAKYGVVGAQVNLTYRIESYTIGGQILITESALTEAGGPDYVQVAGTQEVTPKGVPQAIKIYSVGGVGAPYHQQLTQRQEDYRQLAVPLALTAQSLDGKHVSDRLWSVTLVALSERSGELQVNSLAADELIWRPLTNLKINLSEAVLPVTMTPSLENLEMYVKVLAAGDRPDRCLVQFTGRSPDLTYWLQSLYDCANAEPVAASAID